MAAGNSCANLPFSITALLTSSDHPTAAVSPNAATEMARKAAELAECLPLIFGAPLNLPFGLAQLLAKNDPEKMEEEEGEEEDDDDEHGEETILEDCDEEREGKEMKIEKIEEEEEEDDTEQERGEEKKKTKLCDNLPEQSLDFGPFPPAGWLFPIIPRPATFHPPPPAHLARLPCLPPPFGSALLKSPIFPLFSPFQGICGAQNGGGAHHQQNQQISSQHKRKGGQIRFSNDQTDTLESTFDAKKYLTNAERKRLAKALALSERQVKTWFQNRRAKWRRQLPAGPEGLTSPEEEASAAEQQIHLTTTAASRNALFGHFCGLSD